MLIRARSLAYACVLAAASALAPQAASGQYVDVPRAPAYALQGVTVVHADGRRQEGVTVVVRGRFIEAMAPDAAVPPDAEVLEGDSLVIYPGLVDGEGKAEHAFPKEEIDRSTLELWDAPRSLQGFMPARRLAAHLTATGETVDAQRKAGIVAAAVHPEGAMMPGRGALLMYRVGAERPDALLVRAELGPKFELRGGQGVYPATLFGVVAFMRQAFEDARHRAVVAAAYERDPRGVTMPSYDPDYAVLQAVLAGELTVYFEADEAADILRVIGLADQYGFRPVLMGGADAWKVADELKRRDIPVLVSMDFPEPRRWEPPEEGEPEPVLDAAAAREKAEHEARYANAGRLAAAGVTFALTSGGSGKLLEGARKAVRHGLSPEAALMAMTRTPAQLFGIPHVPRLEAGLPATFIVADGPLFSADTKVAYTFVEGRKEDGASGSGGKAGDPEDAVAFGGAWSITIDADGQILQGTMTIVQDGATFTGTLELPDARMEIREGTIDGDEIRAIAIMREGGQTVEIEMEGTVEGDEARGEADAGPLGVSRWSARRVPGGAR